MRNQIGTRPSFHDEHRESAMIHWRIIVIRVHFSFGINYTSLSFPLYFPIYHPDGCRFETMRRLIGSKDVSVIRKLSNSRQLDVFFARFSSIYLARLLLFFFYFDDREVTHTRIKCGGISGNSGPRRELNGWLIQKSEIR